MRLIRYFPPCLAIAFIWTATTFYLYDLVLFTVFIVSLALNHATLLQRLCFATFVGLVWFGWQWVELLTTALTYGIPYPDYLNDAVLYLSGHFILIPLAYTVAWLLRTYLPGLRPHRLHLHPVPS